MTGGRGPVVELDEDTATLTVTYGGHTVAMPAAVLPELVSLVNVIADEVESRKPIESVRCVRCQVVLFTARGSLLVDRGPFGSGWTIESTKDQYCSDQDLCALTWQTRSLTDFQAGDWHVPDPGNARWPVAQGDQMIGWVCPGAVREDFGPTVEPWRWWTAAAVQSGGPDVILSHGYLTRRMAVHAVRLAAAGELRPR